VFSVFCCCGSCSCESKLEREREREKCAYKENCMNFACSSLHMFEREREREKERKGKKRRLVWLQNCWRACLLRSLAHI